MCKICPTTLSRVWSKDGVLCNLVWCKDGVLCNLVCSNRRHSKITKLILNHLLDSNN